MVTHRGSQLDQALINEQILSQLDAISKSLTATTKAPAAWPKARKSVSVKGTASSSLNRSSVESDLHKN